MFGVLLMAKILILEGNPASRNHAATIAAMLRKLGIDYDTKCRCDVDGSGNVANEANYDGCIAYSLDTRASGGNATDKLFIGAAHNFGGISAPVLCVEAIYCGDNTPISYSGCSGAIAGGAPAGGWNAKTWLDSDSGQIPCQNVYASVKSGNWDEAYNTNLMWWTDGGDENPIIWKHYDGGSRNFIYSNFPRLMSTTQNFWGLLLSIGYYFNELGITVPKPMLFRVDIDDINDCPPHTDNASENCITEMATNLRARNAIATCGINTQTAQHYLTFKESAQLTALRVNTDVFKFILHDHDTNHLWFADDTNFATPAVKLAAAVAAAATVSSDCGVTCGVHNGGYMYFPNNSCTFIGRMACMSGGATKIRKYANEFSPMTSVMARGGQWSSWPKGVFDAAETKRLKIAQSYIAGLSGGSADYTWTGILDTSEVYNAVAAQEWGVIKWLTHEHMESLMFHGPNLAVDGNHKVLLDFLELNLERSMDFVGSNAIRYANADDA